MKKLYSVTQVLSPFNSHLSAIPSHILERAANRGIEVHRACGNYAQGIWVKKLAIDVIPYVHSFIRWFIEYVEVVYMVEERLIDQELGFHGRLDFYLKMVDGWEGIVDIKNPIVEAPTWKAQCAAYKHLIELKQNKNGIGAMALQLNNRGGMPRAIHYQHSADDFAAFLSALNAYRYFNE